jgi:hypothetical protein
MQVYAPCENNTIYTICEKAEKYVIRTSSKQQASAQTAAGIGVCLFHLMVDVPPQAQPDHCDVATIDGQIEASR